MATDFTYGGKQILAGGPIKPNGKDMPVDARTRVESYADIASIPNPHVGLKITVKVDETNNNKMTDYIVKSLKADSLGIANTVIDEVVRYMDYLGVNTSGSSGEGLTSEQSQQLQTAYQHSQSAHVQASDIPTKTSDLQNDSGFITSIPEEYITETELNAKGYLTSHQDISGLQPKTDNGLATTNKTVVGAINEIKTEIDNIEVSGSGAGLTSEQAQQLQTAYTHSQSDHVTMDEVNAAISNAQLGGGEVDLSAYATKTYADNAVSTALDGHTFKFLTQAEYDSLETKDPLVEYHITDATEPEIIDTTSFATDLSLTGTSLQLKNSAGNLIGNVVTLPSGGSDMNPSDYYTKTEVDTKIGDINTILDNINGEVI